MIFGQKTMILLLATTLRRRIWIDSHRCFSVFAKFGSKRDRKTCVEKTYHATFFKEFMQLFLDAFGSAATDVSAFWLNKKMLFFHEILFFSVDFLDFRVSCPLKWLGSHRCFSVLAKPFFTTGFWGWQQHLQRDLNKNGRKIKKVRFFDKTGRRQYRPFSRAGARDGIYNGKIRCKFHKFPL